MQLRPVLFVATALLSLAASPVAPPAPPLEVATLDGSRFDLAAQRGHAVILNVWATWCAPCRVEMPMLSAFYAHHQNEGLVMLGLSVDTPRDLALVRKVAAGVSYPVALAQGASKNGFPAANALPVTYLIDADGGVRARLTPDAIGLTEQKLAALMAPLLRPGVVR
jgi:thiol-disulfide isomerase/thioredoxin